MRTHLILIFVLLCASLAVAQVTVQSFDGLSAGSLGATKSFNADANGAVGTKQYLEWVNSAYQGYNKTTFAKVFPSPVMGDTPWRNAGMPDCFGSGGDGIILFDHLASRWVIGTRHGQGTYFYCIAVSNSDDLTAPGFGWSAYELPLNPILGQNSLGHAYFADFPRLGTWADGYYVSIDLEDPDNGFREVGVVVCAFDRTSMLAGATARTPQCFRNPSTITGSLFLAHSLLPADIEGTVAPPANAAELFVSIQNPSGTGTISSTLNFWKFHVDWVTPANSTFSAPIVKPVSSYTPGCYAAAQPANTICVPEPSSATSGFLLDSLGDRLMHRFAYRRFLTPTAVQSYLVTQTIQVNPAVSRSQTAIRWYEFRPGGVLANTGMINPATDTNYRFMPSAAQDKNRNMAVGYSVSDTTLHPAIKVSTLSLSPLSAPTEVNIVTGNGDQENSSSWGNYSSMTVDPVDGCTFWYVNQYDRTNQTGTAISWSTRIAKFKLPTCL